jgi:cell division protease FtsH
MVVFDEITTGAENDLKEASSLARRMVGLWGMSEDVGPVYLGTGEEHVFLGREITQEKAFSDATAQRLDIAVREIVEQALTKAISMNRTYRQKLDALVSALMEKETLDAAEVTGILGPPTPVDHEVGIAVPQAAAATRAE